MLLTRHLLAFAVILLWGMPGLNHAAQADPQQSANWSATYLAGHPSSEASPLFKLTSEKAWTGHAKSLSGLLQRVESQTLIKVRGWSREHLPTKPPVLLYPFSGPDFLFAEAFHGTAATYVLAGLEPVGDIPSPVKLAPRQRAEALSEVRHTLRAFLDYGFFRTKDMREELASNRFVGVVPLLLIFMAHADKEVISLEPISLAGDGTVGPRLAPQKRKKGEPQLVPGVRIRFKPRMVGSGPPESTLYYLQADLSNSGLSNSGFETFVSGLGESLVLVKSASYLMHLNLFSQIKSVLLDSARVIIQDDSGIPLRSFKGDTWSVLPFGKYIGPIDKFPQLKPQRDMRKLFASDEVRPLDFGIGYRWREQQSNLLLAVKRSALAARE